MGSLVKSVLVSALMLVIACDSSRIGGGWSAGETSSARGAAGARRAEKANIKAAVAAVGRLDEEAAGHVAEVSSKRGRRAVVDRALARTSGLKAKERERAIATLRAIPDDWPRAKERRRRLRAILVAVAQAEFAAKRYEVFKLRCQEAEALGEKVPWCTHARKRLAKREEKARIKEAAAAKKAAGTSRPAVTPQPAATAVVAKAPEPVPPSVAATPAIPVVTPSIPVPTSSVESRTSPVARMLTAIGQALVPVVMFVLVVGGAFRFHRVRSSRLALRLAQKEEITECSSTLVVHDARCLVCGWVIESDEQFVSCRRCGTPHHAECWRYNRACATYGCNSRGAA